MKTKIKLIGIFLIILGNIQVYAGNELTTSNEQSNITHERYIDLDAFFVLDLGLNFKPSSMVPDQNLKRSEALCAGDPGCPYPPIMCMKLYNWGCNIACCNVCYCPGPPF